MTKLCDECETVAHCAKHGCIPKQPASVQGYVTGLDVYLDPADMKPKRYPAAQPEARQMPQCFIDGQRVGGLAGLQAALKELGL